MTLEQFKAMVKELLGEDALSEKDDAWGQIEKGLEDTVTESVSGVIKNRDKILTEKKALAEEMEGLNKQVQFLKDEGITPEIWKEMKEKAELGAQTDNKDIQAETRKAYEQGKKAMEAELTPKLKEFGDKVSELTQAQEAMRNRHISALKDSELSRVLNKLNVETDPFWLRGLSSSANVEYIEAADKVEIALPNPNDESQMIPLSDWAKLFPVSEEGKRRIKVQNIGGGAGGSGSSGGNRPRTLEDSIGNLFKQ